MAAIFVREIAISVKMTVYLYARISFIHQTQYLYITLHAEFCKIISLSVTCIQQAKIQDGHHFNMQFAKIMQTYPNFFLQTSHNSNNLSKCGSCWLIPNLLYLIAHPCLYWFISLHMYSILQMPYKETYDSRQNSREGIFSFFFSCLFVMYVFFYCVL